MWCSGSRDFVKDVAVGKLHFRKDQEMDPSETAAFLPEMEYLKLHHWLLLTGTYWNHEMDYDFPETVGNFIIQTDEVIFFRGVAIPPTS